MDEKKEIIKAFAYNKLESDGFEPTEHALKSLSQHIQIFEGESNESEEFRSVDIDEDTDGKVSAKHFSLYNLIEVNFYDLFQFSLDGVAIMGMAGKPMFQIAYAALRVITDFAPKLTYEFNETDAKILLAIYHTKDKDFKVDEVSSKYLESFSEAIDQKRLNIAIGFFRKKGILRYLGNDLYRKEERVSYERAY